MKSSQFIVLLQGQSNPITITELKTFNLISYFLQYITYQSVLVFCRQLISKQFLVLLISIPLSPIPRI